MLIKTNKLGVIDAPVVKANAKTVIVCLPDGNHIKRHKIKHAA
jgi:hypothetical protein